MLAKDHFSTEERSRILEAIQKAEKNTSGEIRLHVESICKKLVLDRASEVFALLKMHQTEQRNGVLIYLSVKDRKLAIIGDVGIHQFAGIDFWEQIKNDMIAAFKEGKLCQGLEQGIMQVGTLLSAHFPYLKNDQNELSDEISFGQ